MSLLENSAVVSVDREVARRALSEYRNAKSPATDEDRAIMTAYREIARGRVVVQAVASIRNAGRNDAGLPKLAITKADVRRCHCSSWGSRVTFSAVHKRYANQGSSNSRVVVDNMPTGKHADGIAVVPLVPLNVRPKHDLNNYWILWEADWYAVPRDPLLLRKLMGDLWLVLAVWDLTEVERAVLSQRVALV